MLYQFGNTLKKIRLITSNLISIYLNFIFIFAYERLSAREHNRRISSFRAEAFVALIGDLKFGLLSRARLRVDGMIGKFAGRQHVAVDSDEADAAIRASASRRKRAAHADVV